MRTTWSFSTSPTILFGRGAAKQVAPQLVQRGWRRALLVTDQRLLAAGVAGQVEASFAAEQVACARFAETEAEPSLATARRAIEMARSVQPTVVVGLGGGSCLDLAKIVAVALAHGGEPHEYFGFNRVPGPIIPLVCVPTTAGTGSEVSHSAVLTDTEAQMKVSTLSPYLRPALAIVDPLLSVSCPRQVTADSGIDALVHAVEAYLALDYSQLDAAQLDSGQDREIAYQGAFPLSDMLAEQAIRLVAQHLAPAVTRPDDLAAREGMSLAALLAGMAFSNAGVGIVHALEYPLGGALHCSHGGGNGMLLPYVLEFNLPVCTPRLAQIAAWLGCDVATASPAAAARAAIEAIVQLRQEIGIPHTLADLGGTREQLPQFAAKAFAVRRLMAMNPQPVGEADLLAILQRAYDGVLG